MSLVEIIKVKKGSVQLAQIAEMEIAYFSVPWSYDLLVYSIESGDLFCLCLENEQGVLAYCTFQVIIDEVHIINIAVHHEHRNKGFGRKMLLSCMSFALERDCDKMTLEVRVGNEAARGLYKKLGFEDCGIRPKYYDNIEDAVIMWNVNVADTLNHNSIVIRNDEA